MTAVTAGWSRSQGWVARGATAFAVAAALGTAGWVAAGSAAPSRALGAQSVVLAGPAPVVAVPESREQRLREFRSMIVALYSVPADGSAPGGDPIAELRWQLTRHHGAASFPALGRAQALTRRAPALPSLGA